MPRCNFFLRIVILFILFANINNSFADWKYITPLKMSCYTSYADDENLLVGYTFLGIRKFNIKPGIWSDVSYNLVGKEINSLSSFKGTYLSATNDGIFQLDTLEEVWKLLSDTSSNFMYNTSKIAVSSNYLFALINIDNSYHLFRYNFNTNEVKSLLVEENEMINLNPLALDVKDKKVVVTEKGGSRIFLSDNYGETFKSIKFKPAGEDEFDAPVIIKIQGSYIAAYSNLFGFIFSNDSAKTWQLNKAPQTLVNFIVNDIIIDFEQIFLATNYGVYYSDYNLNSWYKSINGLYELNILSICNNHKHFFATSGGNIYQIDFNELEMGFSEIPSLIYPRNKTYIEPLDIFFNWRKCNGALSYKLLVATDSLFEDIIINENDIEENIYYVETLPKSDYYYWKAASVYENGNVFWSDSAVFGLLDNVQIPELIYPPDKSEDIDTAITFLWRKNRLAIAYDFEISKDSGFESPILNWSNLPDTSLQIMGLKKNTTYFWRICPIWDMETYVNICGTAEFTTGKKLNVFENTIPLVQIFNNYIMITDDAFTSEELFILDYLGRKIEYNIITNGENTNIVLKELPKFLIVFYKGSVYKFLNHSF